MGIWDYFMRRKKLLLLIVAIFALSGFGASKVLENFATAPANTPPEVTYIQIQNWGTPEDIIEGDVDIPRTGETRPFATLLNPSEVVLLPTSQATSSTQDSSSDPQDDLSIPVDGEALAQDFTNSSEVAQTKPETVVRTHQLTFAEVCADLILTLLSFSIIVLGCYLTYQHFMR